MNDTNIIENRRNNVIDAAKGLLIVTVVMGHARVALLHDIIFLFHMPLFFIISGFLLSGKLIDRKRIGKSCTKMLIPYIIYLLTDCVVINGLPDKNMCLKTLLGGRALSGVYWYITAYLFALVVFGLMQRYLPQKCQKPFILVCGILAVIESNVILKLADDSSIVKLLKFPGVPWNLDVSLLILVYFALGYWFHSAIYTSINSTNKYIDIAAAALAVILTVLCFINYSGDTVYYYFDMKYVYYKELLSAVLIPLAFGLVIVRILRFLNGLRIMEKFMNCLSFLGRITLPIMFLHVPLNSFQEHFGYGLLLYVLIGIGIPVLLTLVFGRFKTTAALLGMPVTVNNHSSAKVN